MPVQLSYGGVFWRLPKERTLESIRDDIEKAMNEGSALPVTLDGGETLILHGGQLTHVLVFDDKGDPNRAPSSFWSLATLVGANPANVIRISPASVISSGTDSVISPASVISSGTDSVISSGTGSVISSGTGSVISAAPSSITISWGAGQAGRW